MNLILFWPLVEQATWRLGKFNNLKILFPFQWENSRLLPLFLITNSPSNEIFEKDHIFLCYMRWQEENSKFSCSFFIKSNNLFNWFRLSGHIFIWNGKLETNWNSFSWEMSFEIFLCIKYFPWKLTQILPSVFLLILFEFSWNFSLS